METPLIVGGSIAQRAGFGGHAWAFIQYLLGFKELGYSPLLVDQLLLSMCIDEAGRPSRQVRDGRIRWFVRNMDAAGLGDSYALLLDDGESVGASRKEAIRQAAHAPLLLNVMGFLADEDILAAAPQLVFLDIDPGFTQMWRELGLADVLTGHDLFVTLAQNIGLAECDIPTCGLDWHASRPPVALHQWPAVGPGTYYATIASWRGPFAPITYQGRRYGVRAHEFRKYASLPRLVEGEFHIALDIDPADRRDLALLRESGWKLADRDAAAGNLSQYRRYIQAAQAEIMIPKEMYTITQSGWFSDRSVCFLASGRPVIAADTGISAHYPTGRGLHVFSSLDEAATAAREVASGWCTNSAEARAIAEEYFDARRVCGELLRVAGAA